MTDPIEAAEQRRQQIAMAMEELEAAANAFSDEGSMLNETRLYDAVFSLREARNPKPSAMDRVRQIEIHARAHFDAVNRLAYVLTTEQPTPDQLAQIEKWEREIEGKE